MTKTYRYTLQYKNEEPVYFGNLIDCLPYIEKMMDNKEITRDVLNDYFTKNRRIHQIIFNDWTVARERITTRKEALVSLPCISV